MGLFSELRKSKRYRRYQDEQRNRTHSIDDVLSAYGVLASLPGASVPASPDEKTSADDVLIDNPSEQVQATP